MTFIIIPAEFRVFELKLQFLRYPLVDGWETAWDLEDIYIDVAAATAAAEAATLAAAAATETADTAFTMAENAQSSVSALAIQVGENTTNITGLAIDIGTAITAADNATIAAAAASSAASSASSAAAAAQTTANTAVTNAAAASTAAAAAQTTANNASGANGKLGYFAVMGEEFTWVAGARTIAISNVLPYNLFVGSTTNNATAEINLPLLAGTWSFWVMTSRRADAANLLLKIGSAAAIAGHNLYKAAPPDYTYIASVTGVTVVNAALTAIQVWADGHTNPSTGYVMTVTKVWGLRTGA